MTSSFDHTTPEPIQFDDNGNPDAPYNQWGNKLYLSVTIILNSLLICAYLVTLYRAVKGPAYSFIIILLTLLLVSNIGSVCTVTYNHKVSVFSESLVEALEAGTPLSEVSLKEGVHYLDIEAGMVFLRDGFFNEAICFFSLRYWAISFVIPWQLERKEFPKWWKVVHPMTFTLGLLLNFLIPFMYGYYAFRINR